MTFYSKYKTFHSRKCIWTYRLRNGGHFVQGWCVNIEISVLVKGRINKWDITHTLWLTLINTERRQRKSTYTYFCLKKRSSYALYIAFQFVLADIILSPTPLLENHGKRISSLLVMKYILYETWAWTNDKKHPFSSMLFIWLKTVTTTSMYKVLSTKNSLRENLIAKTWVHYNEIAKQLSFETINHINGKWSKVAETSRKIRRSIVACPIRCPK